MTPNNASHNWTADEIQKRLGTSTIVFSRDRRLLSEDIEMIAARGIKHIEICGLGNPGHLDVEDNKFASFVHKETERNGVKVVSTHSPGYNYTSDDEDNRTAAVAHGVKAARVSEELGAGVMVCHFRPDEPSERSITEMLDQLDNTSIKLAIENGRDLAEYTSFVDRIGSERFGMVVDVGHTRDDDEVNPFIKRDRARETMAQCGQRLIHLHLHDWVDRDHFSPLDGALQWGEVFAAFKDIGYKGYFMFEAAYPPGRRGEGDPPYVLDKVGEFPTEFVKHFAT